MLKQAKLNQGTQAALDAIQNIDAEGRAIITRENKDTQTAIWWTIIYLDAAHQLSLLFFTFVCFKSFIYVFARVSFNRDTGTFVTLGNIREAMNKIEMHQGDEAVSCTTTKGIEFFEWNLVEGETVILDFHYFVYMSESIKVSTFISPRISSLLLGKMIFSQATGPGKLILMAKGRAEIVVSKGSASSLPPERMLAIHKDTRLHIDSE